MLTPDAHVCWGPACGVGYFDAWSRSVPAAVLKSPAYPKAPDAPVCACLGVSAAALTAQARAGERDIVLRILAHIRGGQAACAHRSPDGESCERRVRRLFREETTR